MKGFKVKCVEIKTEVQLLFTEISITGLALKRSYAIENCWDTYMRLKVLYIRPACFIFTIISS